jgi:hypothetical protein
MVKRMALIVQHPNCPPPVLAGIPLRPSVARRIAPTLRLTLAADYPETEETLSKSKAARQQEFDAVLAELQRRDPAAAQRALDSYNRETARMEQAARERDGAA